MRDDGRVLVSHVVGPWNAELVAAWVSRSDPWARAASAKGAHGGITVIEGSMLSTPEALEMMRQAIRYAASYPHCVGHAIVARADVEGRVLMAPIFAQAHEGVCPYRLFEDLAEARAWMDGLIAQT